MKLMEHGGKENILEQEVVVQEFLHHQQAHPVMYLSIILTKTITIVWQHQTAPQLIIPQLNYLP